MLIFLIYKYFFRMKNGSNLTGQNIETLSHLQQNNLNNLLPLSPFYGNERNCQKDQPVPFLSVDESFGYPLP